MIMLNSKAQLTVDIIAKVAERKISVSSAQLVFKSEGTVENQVSNVLSKLGVRDRTREVLKETTSQKIQTNHKWCSIHFVIAHSFSN